MKIDFFINERFKEPEIRICNHELTEELVGLKNTISKLVNKMLAGYRDGEVEMLPCDRIYRIYSLNQRTIAETEDESFVLHDTLRELEEALFENQFVRISKSELVNLRKVKKLDTKLAGTIKVFMQNGSETFVSRRNVTKIKQMLGM